MYIIGAEKKTMNKKIMEEMKRNIFAVSLEDYLVRPEYELEERIRQISRHTVVLDILSNFLVLATKIIGFHKLCILGFVRHDFLCISKPSNGDAIAAHLKSKKINYPKY